MARTKVTARKPYCGKALATKAARKSVPVPTGVKRVCSDPEGDTCDICGASAVTYHRLADKMLCLEHAKAERDELQQAVGVAEAAEQRRREEARKAARKAARADARAVAERDALEALQRAAEDESSESEGGELPSSALPHALAHKTLRVQYALRTASPADLVAHLRARMSGGDAAASAAVQMLSALLPKACFPPEPEELATCPRCDEAFDEAYAIGACKTPGDFITCLRCQQAKRLREESSSSEDDSDDDDKGEGDEEDEEEEEVEDEEAGDEEDEEDDDADTP